MTRHHRPLALVTGGSAGLGRALVHALHDRGWTVVTDGRDAGRLSEATRDLDNVAAVPGDVAEPSHRAELVAAVMKVEVTVGQRVAAEDPVVLLESMKMEIPVLAEVTGSVVEIVVGEGDVVNDGDPLVVIEPDRS